VLVAALSVYDDAAVLVVLREWLNGVTLIADADARCIATVRGNKFLLAFLGTLLRIPHVYLWSSSALIGIAND